MEVAADIRKLTITDAEYPELLRQIPDAPPVLYVRGKLENQRELPMVAVVGTRKPTPYGVAATERLVTAIAPGCVVVSGLAYGIDGLAHLSAVKVGGITWAVLGTGIDDASIYPVRHLALAKQILAGGGALLTEHPPGTPPLKHHFPMRNRIIAGLSEKVVVVEAPETSGAVITAKLALDYNREVLAVPGPIFSPNSAGTNRLIAEGARPVLGAGDIIEVKTHERATQLTTTGEVIYKALGSGAKHINDIVEQTGLTAAAVSTELTMLEIRGLVRCVGTGMFVIVQ